MYNLLVSLGLALVTFVVVALILRPVAGVVPALLVFGVAFFLLTRRVGRRVNAEMEPLLGMLQAQQIDRAREHLEGIKRRWGPWQFLLAGQIDAQLGMLDYVQMKWDEALPKLQAGRFRNGQAQVAIGAIHHRRGELEAAWRELESAVKTSPKDVVVYLVYATLLARSGERNRALEVLGRGLQVLPDSEILQQTQKDLANKRRLRTDRYPESWYQFFPEELVKSQLVRGRRGPQPGLPQPRFGAKMAPRR